MSNARLSECVDSWSAVVQGIAVGLRQELLSTVYNLSYFVPDLTLSVKRHEVIDD